MGKIYRDITIKAGEVICELPIHITDHNKMTDIKIDYDSHSNFKLSDRNSAAFAKVNNKLCT